VILDYFCFPAGLPSDGRFDKSVLNEASWPATSQKVIPWRSPPWRRCRSCPLDDEKSPFQNFQCIIHHYEGVWQHRLEVNRKVSRPSHQIIQMVSRRRWRDY